MKLILIINAIVLFRSISTLIFMLQSLQWLKNEDLKIKDKNKTNKTKVTILLPVLREQKRIIPTLIYLLNNFSNKNLEIIIITTQREFEKKFTGNSTQVLVENFISRRGLGKFVSVINYPELKGNMADQLNFALSKLNSNGYICLYNADSKPHPKTLHAFYKKLEDEKGLLVAQQSSIFVKNFNNFKGSRLKILFLQASSILQTRWTLTHEIPRLLRQSGSNRFLKKYANAHVVGHGLFIKTSLIKKLRGFPTKTLTEDLFLGYLLRCKGIAIHPIPLLEIADSPESVKGLWTQKYVWFWGPMKYMKYFRHVVRNKKSLNIKSLITPFFFTVQGLISASAWIISGPFILILILSTFTAIPLSIRLLSIFSVVIYGPLQYAITYQYLPKLMHYAGQKYKAEGWLKTLIISIMSLPAIAFHSIPPLYSILREIYSRATKKTIFKAKTE